MTVTVAPDGSVKDAKIAQTSGSQGLDDAALAAAKDSTYWPAVASCTAITGTYKFKASFDFY